MNSARPSSVSASPAAKYSQTPVVPINRLRMKAASAGRAAPSSMEMVSVRDTRSVA